MNYNILRYVITVAEERSFTKAAKKLYITQPSLSQTIKNEEEKLGIILFNRNCSPLTLTDAGKEYVLWARQVLTLYEDMKKRLFDFSTNEASSLKVGILPEFNSFILARPLKIFLEKNPNTFVQISEQSTNDLEKNLKNSKLDFIIALTYNDKYNYYSEPLYDEKIVLAVTSDFLPKNKDALEIDLIEYKNAPFIVMEEGQFLYNATHDLCQKSGFVPRAVVQCYNLETALNMIKSGIGVSIVPDLMCKVVGGIKYYNIKGYAPESQISIVYSRNRYLTKKTRELIDLIKEHINNEKMYEEFIYK